MEFGVVFKADIMPPKTKCTSEELGNILIEKRYKEYSDIVNQRPDLQFSNVVLQKRVVENLLGEAMATNFFLMMEVGIKLQTRWKFLYEAVANCEISDL